MKNFAKRIPGSLTVSTLIFAITITSFHLYTISDFLDQGYFLKGPLKTIGIYDSLSSVLNRGSMIVGMGLEYVASIFTFLAIPVFFSAIAAKPNKLDLSLIIVATACGVFIVYQNAAMLLVLIYYMSTLPLLALVFLGGFSTRRLLARFGSTVPQNTSNK